MYDYITHSATEGSVYSSGVTCVIELVYYKLASISDRILNGSVPGP